MRYAVRKFQKPEADTEHADIHAGITESVPKIEVHAALPQFPFCLI